MRLKSFLMALVAYSFSFTACTAGEKVITYPELPLDAQRLIEKHSQKADVSVVIMDKEAIFVEYEVRLTDGTKLEFEKNGEFKKIDCGSKAVPEALVPEAVRSYVKTSFPNTLITEWGKDDRRWKAELSNGVDLLFDKKYQFVGIDD